MSVTDAAKRLGVGRPRPVESTERQFVIVPHYGSSGWKKSFGADRRKLLELQSEFDRHNRRGKEKTVAARAYVPGFLTIKARQIQEWADEQSRSSPPVTGAPTQVGPFNRS